MGIFHELRQKPNHIKSRYAFLGATLLTLGIGMIWVTSLPARFALIGGSVRESKQEARVGGGFTDLVEEVRKGVDEIAADFPPEEVFENSLRSEDTEDLLVATSSGSGALGGLDAWDTSLSNVTQIGENDETGEVVQEESSGGAAASTSVILVPTPVPPPKTSVILIGTTTSKKRE